MPYEYDLMMMNDAVEGLGNARKIGSDVRFIACGRKYKRAGVRCDEAHVSKQGLRLDTFYIRMYYNNTRTYCVEKHV